MLSAKPSSGVSGDPAAISPPERQVAESLLAATLLAFAGGNLDAFLYLDHGRVFAGAMTGNAVLCGIALLSREWHTIGHHALPIFAFAVGVWLSEMLASRIKHHAVTLGLALEITGLLVASFLPSSFPDAVFIFVIALLAAFQIGSFRKLDSYSYNSTFITGDLRTLVVGLYEAAHPDKTADGIRQARDLGCVVGAFLLGALAGAGLAHPAGNHTLWLPAAALLIVFGIALRRSLRPEREVTQQPT